MDDTTSLLFGLDSFSVVDVVRVADRAVQVVVETVERQGFCTACGRGSTRVKDGSLVRIRDLRVADQQVALWWRKRGLVCLERTCVRGSFTQTAAEIAARYRLTVRLRQRLAEAVARSNGRCQRSPRSSGCTGARCTGPLSSAARSGYARGADRVLGIDETGLARCGGSCTTSGGGAATVDDLVRQRGHQRPGLLLGLARGGTAAVYGPGSVSRQPSSGPGSSWSSSTVRPYASGIRAALPQARIAVDHWHLIRLANDMLTEVRQRVTRQLHQRRGLATDPVWAHRRMLLTAGNRLSRKQLARLDRVLATDDRTNEIGAPGPARSCSGNCWPSTTGPGSGQRCGGSTAPAPRRTCPKPDDSRPRSRPGGQRSSSHSPSRSRTRGPRASTGSSSRSRGWAVGSQTWKLGDGYSPLPMEIKVRPNATAGAVQKTSSPRQHME